MQLIDIAKTVSTLGCMSAGRNCILFLRMCPGKSGDGEVDPMIFIPSSGKIKSFDEYVRTVDKDAYNFTFTHDQQQILEYVSQWLINGKRIEELAMLKLVVDVKQFHPIILLLRFRKSIRIIYCVPRVMKVLLDYLRTSM